MAGSRMRGEGVRELDGGTVARWQVRDLERDHRGERATSEPWWGDEFPPMQFFSQLQLGEGVPIDLLGVSPAGTLLLLQHAGRRGERCDALSHLFRAAVALSQMDYELLDTAVRLHSGRQLVPAVADFALRHGLAFEADAFRQRLDRHLRRGSFELALTPGAEHVVADAQAPELGAICAMVVDDGGCVGAGLAMLLSSRGMRAEHVHADCLQLVTAIAPQVLVLDGDMGEERLRRCAAHAKTELPDARVKVVLGQGVGSVTSPLPGIDVGGWIPADLDPDEFVRIIRDVDVASDCRAMCSPDDPAGTESSMAALTARETEVLRHVMSGASSKSIAGALEISPHTVRTHLQNILAKLDVDTRLQAALAGFSAGLRPTTPRQHAAA